MIEKQIEQSLLTTTKTGSTSSKLTSTLVKVFLSVFAIALICVVINVSSTSNPTTILISPYAAKWKDKLTPLQYEVAFE